MFDWMGAFVIAAVAGVAWRYGAARTARWSSIAARLPETRIGDLAEGAQVKVVGVVEDRETMPAPLTQRPCVGWTIRSVAADGGWVLDRIARSGACDFWLRDDAGGRVQVRGGRAALVVATANAVSAARVEGMVQREALFVPGDRIAVIGMVRRELDPTGVTMYREAPTRLVLDGIPLWLLPVS
ncbi:MAG TPA: hypothetical protein VN947_25390 [Polyangia bacterium]|nr:hypothetical protein [Polyangia bacterium]